MSAASWVRHRAMVVQPFSQVSEHFTGKCYWAKPNPVGLAILLEVRDVGILGKMRFVNKWLLHGALQSYFCQLGIEKCDVFIRRERGVSSSPIMRTSVTTRAALTTLCYIVSNRTATRRHILATLEVLDCFSKMALAALRRFGSERVTVEVIVGSERVAVDVVVGPRVSLNGIARVSRAFQATWEFYRNSNVKCSESPFVGSPLECAQLSDVIRFCALVFGNVGLRSARGLWVSAVRQLAKAIIRTTARLWEVNVLKMYLPEFGFFAPLPFVIRNRQKKGPRPFT